MSNIHYLPSSNRLTTGTRTDNFARKVIERAHQIAAKPAYVTQNATINRVVTDLELKGWHVECHPCGEITCHHPQVKTVRPRPITLMEAQQVQRILEGE